MTKDLKGSRYGSLTVTAPAAPRGGRSAWHCTCDCGGSATVLTGNLRAEGGTRSCGCLQKQRTREVSTTHGLSHSPEWFHWVRMLQRVSEKSPDRADYFDRGITVSSELQTFTGFLAEIGPRPPGPLRWTVGRIDNMKGYAPGNVEWQTYRAQARARRMPCTNTSGIFGVSFQGGKYRARWYDLEGKARSKTFSDPTEAVEFRAGVIAELNAAGANYHPSNGKTKC